MSQHVTNVTTTIGLHEIFDHLKPDNRLNSAIYITCLMSEEQVKKLIEHCQTLLENPEYGKQLLDAVKQDNV